jgi:RES domain-containing protein
VRIFRICRRAFAKNPLDGRGGLAVSGRWHSAPRLVIYASESLSLASLEVLVHADFDLLPKDLVAIELEVSPSMKVSALGRGKLPRNWRHYPAPAALRRMGNAWFDAGGSCVLRVPSVVIPSESNFVLNARHEDVRAIRVVSKTDFDFDPRLVKK